MSPFLRALAHRAAASGLTFAATEGARFEVYYELLRRWNTRINLTALPLAATPEMETLDRLFLEPMLAARFISQDPIACLDLGSGGGSPALPLRILRPSMVLTMVEARARKTAFLREAVRHLGFDDVDVITDRFENLPTSFDDSADLITLRAVRTDADTAATLQRLLEQDGNVLIFGAGERVMGFEELDRQPLLGADSFATLFRPLR